MEITLARALKIVWSILWRTWVLTIPLCMILFPIVAKIIPFPKPGQPPDPARMAGMGGKMFIVWAIAMVGFILVQALAVRWALKTKWSDFKLVAVPVDEI